MKTLFFNISLSALLATCTQAQLVDFANEGLKAEWNKAVDGRSKLFEERALGDGLSSTGKIRVTNIYTLTHNEAIGDKGDKIALLVQEDLFGSRLFSIHIINLRTANTRQLYRAGKPTEAEAGADRPATAPQSKSEGNEKPQPDSKVAPR